MQEGDKRISLMHLLSRLSAAAPTLVDISVFRRTLTVYSCAVTSSIVLGRLVRKGHNVSFLSMNDTIRGARTTSLPMAVDELLSLALRHCCSWPPPLASEAETWCVEEEEEKKGQRSALVNSN
jgi:hypothetical protein